MREASDLFSRQGYRATSLADVADVVGLTQSGLLHHFPSKKDLLIAVLRERDTVGVGHGLGDAPLTLLESLPLELELVKANATTGRRIVELFTVLVGEAIASDHPAREYFQVRYDHVREVWRGRLELARERGEICPDVDTKALAPLVAAVMDGLQIQWLLDESIDMGQCFAAFVAILTKALTNGVDSAPNRPRRRVRS